MTPEQQSIKSILAILDGADTDGSPVGDALQSHSFVIAEALRSICKFNGAETGDKLPFGDLREDITHNAKSECFNNATCETANDKACVCESDYNSFNEETGLCNTCGGHA